MKDLEHLEKFYSISKFAKIFDMHPQTVRRMIKRGELLAVKLAGKWKIPQSEMDRIKGLCSVKED